MITREEFDAEMTEWNRRANERWAAINQEFDRIDASLARTTDTMRDFDERMNLSDARLARIDAQQRHIEEIMERQGMSITLLLEERGKP